MNKLFIVSVVIISLFACGNSTKSNNDSTSANTVSTNDNSDAGAIDAKKLFKLNCALCHGADGKLGANGSKDLTVSELSVDDRIALITNGKGQMVAYKAILTADEIKALAEYTLSFKK